MTSDAHLPLSDMRILVTNDDGIDAPGLKVMVEAALAHSDDVWVVAPATNQSAKSRSMSLRQEVAVEKHGERRFAVHGSPVDCVLIGLNGLLDGRLPDLVLSGVNSGGILADDVGFSGTLGACFESAQEGVPGIGMSQTRGGPKLEVPGPVDWRCAKSMAASLLPTLVESLAGPRSLLNVNFPAVAGPEAVKGIVAAPCGWRDTETRIRKVGEDGERQTFKIAPLRDNITSDDNCDLALTQRGYVTVTPLRLDDTDHDRMAALEQVLSRLVPTGLGQA